MSDVFIFQLPFLIFKVLHWLSKSVLTCIIWPKFRKKRTGTPAAELTDKVPEEVSTKPETEFNVRMCVFLLYNHLFLCPVRRIRCTTTSDSRPWILQHRQNQRSSRKTLCNIRMFVISVGCRYNVCHVHLGWNWQDRSF